MDCGEGVLCRDEYTTAPTVTFDPRASHVTAVWRAADRHVIVLQGLHANFIFQLHTFLYRAGYRFCALQRRTVSQVCRSCLDTYSAVVMSRYIEISIISNSISIYRIESIRQKISNFSIYRDI